MSAYFNTQKQQGFKDFLPQQSGKGRICGISSISRQLIKAHYDGYHPRMSRQLATALKRYINTRPKYERRTVQFIEEVRRKILCLHEYNLQIAKVKFKYPRSEQFDVVLMQYIELECGLLYDTYSDVDKELENQVTQRVLRLLRVILHDALQNTEISLKRTIQACDKALLKLFVNVRADFVSENKLVASTITKLLHKLSVLEDVNKLKGKNIAFQEDTFLRNPLVCSIRQNLATSDYESDVDEEDDDDLMPMFSESLGNSAPSPQGLFSHLEEKVNVMRTTNNFDNLFTFGPKESTLSSSFFMQKMQKDTSYYNSQRLRESEKNLRNSEYSIDHRSTENRLFGMSDKTFQNQANSLRENSVTLLHADGEANTRSKNNPLVTSSDAYFLQHPHINNQLNKPNVPSSFFTKQSSNNDENFFHLGDGVTSKESTKQSRFSKSDIEKDFAQLNGSQARSNEKSIDNDDNLSRETHNVEKVGSSIMVGNAQRKQDEVVAPSTQEFVPTQTSPSHDRFDPTATNTHRDENPVISRAEDCEIIEIDEDSSDVQTFSKDIVCNIKSEVPTFSSAGDEFCDVNAASDIFTLSADRFQNNSFNNKSQPTESVNGGIITIEILDDDEDDDYNGMNSHVVGASSYNLIQSNEIKQEENEENRSPNFSIPSSDNDDQNFWSSGKSARNSSSNEVSKLGKGNKDSPRDADASAVVVSDSEDELLVRSSTCNEETEESVNRDTSRDDVHLEHETNEDVGVKPVSSVEREEEETLSKDRVTEESDFYHHEVEQEQLVEPIGTESVTLGKTVYENEVSNEGNVESGNETSVQEANEEVQEYHLAEIINASECSLVNSRIEEDNASQSSATEEHITDEAQLTIAVNSEIVFSEVVAEEIENSNKEDLSYLEKPTSMDENQILIAAAPTMQIEEREADTIETNVTVEPTISDHLVVSDVELDKRIECESTSTIEHVFNETTEIIEFREFEMHEPLEIVNCETSVASESSVAVEVDPPPISEMKESLEIFEAPKICENEITHASEITVLQESQEDRLEIENIQEQVTIDDDRENVFPVGESNESEISVTDQVQMEIIEKEELNVNCTVVSENETEESRISNSNQNQIHFIEKTNSEEICKSPETIHSEITYAVSESVVEMESDHIVEFSTLEFSKPVENEAVTYLEENNCTSEALIYEPVVENNTESIQEVPKLSEPEGTLLASTDCNIQEEALNPDLGYCVIEKTYENQVEPVETSVDSTVKETKESSASENIETVEEVKQSSVTESTVEQIKENVETIEEIEDSSIPETVDTVDEIKESPVAENIDDVDKIKKSTVSENLNCVQESGELQENLQSNVVQENECIQEVTYEAIDYSVNAQYPPQPSDNMTYINQPPHEDNHYQHVPIYNVDQQHQGLINLQTSNNQSTMLPTQTTETPLSQKVEDKNPHLSLYSLPPTLTEVEYNEYNVEKKVGGDLELLANIAADQETLAVKTDSEKEVVDTASEAESHTKLNSLQTTPRRRKSKVKFESKKKTLARETLPRAVKGPQRRNLPKQPNEETENKRITRNMGIKSKIEVNVLKEVLKQSRTNRNDDSKYKPHDFISLENSILPPRTNNVYAQKRLIEANTTSEDSNDSCESTLFIDLGESQKHSEKAVKSIFDEDTIYDLLEFITTEDKTTVCISIPENDENCTTDSFHILKQMEDFVDNNKKDNTESVPKVEVDVEEPNKVSPQTHEESNLKVDQDSKNAAEDPILENSLSKQSSDETKLVKTTDHSIENILNKAPCNSEVKVSLHSYRSEIELQDGVVTVCTVEKEQPCQKPLIQSEEKNGKSNAFKVKKVSQNNNIPVEVAAPQSRKLDDKKASEITNTKTKKRKKETHIEVTPQDFTIDKPVTCSAINDDTSEKIFKTKAAVKAYEDKLQPNVPIVLQTLELKKVEPQEEYGMRTRLRSKSTEVQKFARFDRSRSSSVDFNALSTSSESCHNHSTDSSGFDESRESNDSVEVATSTISVVNKQVTTILEPQEKNSLSNHVDEKESSLSKTEIAIEVNAPIVVPSISLELPLEKDNLPGDDAPTVQPIIPPSKETNEEQNVINKAELLVTDVTSCVHSDIAPKPVDDQENSPNKTELLGGDDISVLKSGHAEKESSSNEIELTVSNDVSVLTSSISSKEHLLSQVELPVANDTLILDEKKNISGKLDSAVNKVSVDTVEIESVEKIPNEPQNENHSIGIKMKASVSSVEAVVVNDHPEVLSVPSIEDAGVNDHPVVSSVSSIENAAVNDHPVVASVSSVEDAGVNDHRVVASVSSVEDAGVNDHPVVASVSSVEDAGVNDHPVVASVSSIEDAGVNDHPVAASVSSVENAAANDHPIIPSVSTVENVEVNDHPVVPSVSLIENADADDHPVVHSVSSVENVSVPLKADEDKLMPSIGIVEITVTTESEPSVKDQEVTQVTKDTRPNKKSTVPAKSLTPKKNIDRSPPKSKTLDGVKGRSLENTIKKMKEKIQESEKAKQEFSIQIPTVIGNLDVVEKTSEESSLSQSNEIQDLTSKEKIFKSEALERSKKSELVLPSQDMEKTNSLPESNQQKTDEIQTSKDKSDVEKKSQKKSTSEEPKQKSLEISRNDTKRKRSRSRSKSRMFDKKSDSGTDKQRSSHKSSRSRSSSKPRSLDKRSKHHSDSETDRKRRSKSKSLDKDKNQEDPNGHKKRRSRSPSKSKTSDGKSKHGSSERTSKHRSSDSKERSGHSEDKKDHHKKRSSKSPPKSKPLDNKEKRKNDEKEKSKPKNDEPKSKSELSRSENKSKVKTNETNDRLKTNTGEVGKETTNTSETIHKVEHKSSKNKPKTQSKSQERNSKKVDNGVKVEDKTEKSKSQNSVITGDGAQKVNEKDKHRDADRTKSKEKAQETQTKPVHDDKHDSQKKDDHSKNSNKSRRSHSTEKISSPMPDEKPDVQKKDEHSKNSDKSRRSHSKEKISSPVQDEKFDFQKKDDHSKNSDKSGRSHCKEKISSPMPDEKPDVQKKDEHSKSSDKSGRSHSKEKISSPTPDEKPEVQKKDEHSKNSDKSRRSHSKEKISSPVQDEKFDFQKKDDHSKNSDKSGRSYSKEKISSPMPDEKPDVQNKDEHSKNSDKSRRSHSKEKISSPTPDEKPEVQKKDEHSKISDKSHRSHSKEKISSPVQDEKFDFQKKDDHSKNSDKSGGSHSKEKISSPTPDEKHDPQKKDDHPKNSDKSRRSHSKEKISSRTDKRDKGSRERHKEDKKSCSGDTKESESKRKVKENEKIVADEHKQKNEESEKKSTNQNDRLVVDDGKSKQEITDPNATNVLNHENEASIVDDSKQEQAKGGEIEVTSTIPIDKGPTRIAIVEIPKKRKYKLYEENGNFVVQEKSPDGASEAKIAKKDEILVVKSEVAIVIEEKSTELTTHKTVVEVAPASGVNIVEESKIHIEEIRKASSPKIVEDKAPSEPLKNSLDISTTDISYESFASGIKTNSVAMQLEDGKTSTVPLTERKEDKDDTSSVPKTPEEILTKDLPPLLHTKEKDSVQSVDEPVADIPKVIPAVVPPVDTNSLEVQGVNEPLAEVPALDKDLPGVTSTEEIISSEVQICANKTEEIDLSQLQHKEKPQCPSPVKLLLQNEVPLPVAEPVLVNPVFSSSQSIDVRALTTPINSTVKHLPRPEAHLCLISSVSSSVSTDCITTTAVSMSCGVVAASALHTASANSVQQKTCLFSFNEDAETVNRENLNSTDIFHTPIELDDISPTKLPLASNQSLDFISPSTSIAEISNSMNLVQTLGSSTVNFIPDTSEIDIQQATKPNSFGPNFVTRVTEISCFVDKESTADHNYTLGDPLLGGNNEDKNILTTGLSLSNSPEEFQLNESHLDDLSFNENNFIEENGTLEELALFLPCKKEKPDFVCDPIIDEPIPKPEDIQNSIKRLNMLVDISQSGQQKVISVDNTIEHISPTDCTVGLGIDYAVNKLLFLGGGEVTSQNSTFSTIPDLDNMAIMESSVLPKQTLEDPPVDTSSDEPNILVPVCSHYSTFLPGENQKVVVEPVEQYSITSVDQLKKEYMNDTCKTEEKVKPVVKPDRETPVKTQPTFRPSKFATFLESLKKGANKTENTKVKDDMENYTVRRHNRTPVYPPKQKSILQHQRTLTKPHSKKNEVLSKKNEVLSFETNTSKSQTPSEPGIESRIRVKTDLIKTAEVKEQVNNESLSSLEYINEHDHDIASEVVLPFSKPSPSTHKTESQEKKPETSSKVETGTTKHARFDKMGKDYIMENILNVPTESLHKSPVADVKAPDKNAKKVESVEVNRKRKLPPNDEIKRDDKRPRKAEDDVKAHPKKTVLTASGEKPTSDDIFDKLLREGPVNKVFAQRMTEQTTKKEIQPNSSVEQLKNRGYSTVADPSRKERTSQPQSTSLVHESARYKDVRYQKKPGYHTSSGSNPQLDRRYPDKRHIAVVDTSPKRHVRSYPNSYSSKSDPCTTRDYKTRDRRMSTEHNPFPNSSRSELRRDDDEFSWIDKFSGSGLFDTPSGLFMPPGSKRQDASSRK
ncbi:hypothetical protein Zmor_007133 [Zophobas morio]|uniref:Uncharacterized protein n=1 Tax=Zophobas morio TaxID=2755281 RepID=A0AA38ITA0_9CUCU|nr:hypothetical protein Zmor_007133 [Zophobas morio]